MKVPQLLPGLQGKLEADLAGNQPWGRSPFSEAPWTSIAVVLKCVVGREE